jgi:hypothetical protein
METTIITSLLCFLLGLSGGMSIHIKEKIMPLTKKGAKMKKETPKAYGAVKGAAKKTAKKATKKTSKKK